MGVEELLSQVPEKRVLFSISPAAAREFGILPVGIRDPGAAAPILEVIGTEGIEKIDETLSWQIFRKITNYMGYVSPEKWQEAYFKFYKDLLQ